MQDLQRKEPITWAYKTLAINPSSTERQITKAHLDKSNANNINVKDNKDVRNMKRKQQDNLDKAKELVLNDENRKARTN
jgi:hypothetical protein